MFHTVPPEILKRMQYLEHLDAQDRQDGSTLLQRLRQVPPETGRFLAVLAASAPPGAYLEIGTSAGYSTLWLALACRELGRCLITFEVLEEKAHLAKETFRLARVEEIVKLVEGDAREFLRDYTDISFCFLDAEKEHYLECYELLIPNMVSGGLLVADNAISHRDPLKPFLDRTLADERVDSLIVPIGKGVLVCRKI
jgi:caffeoyl-CoA O-methyltransferase